MAPPHSTIRILGLRIPTLALALTASIAAHAVLIGAVGWLPLSPNQSEIQPPTIEFSMGNPIRVYITQRPPNDPTSEPQPKVDATPLTPPTEQPAARQMPKPDWKAFTDRLDAMLHAVRELDWSPAVDRPQPERTPPTHDDPTPAHARQANVPEPSQPEHAPSAAPPEVRAPGLSSAIKIIDCPQPRYPRRSLRLGQQGTAIIAVRVLADGRIRSVALHQSSGHDLLDRAALEAARQGRFTPAMREGAPIDATVRVPFEFKIRVDPPRGR